MLASERPDSTVAARFAPEEGGGIEQSDVADSRSPSRLRERAGLTRLGEGCAFWALDSAG